MRCTSINSLVKLTGIMLSHVSLAPLQFTFHRILLQSHPPHIDKHVAGAMRRQKDRHKYLLVCALLMQVYQTLFIYAGLQTGDVRVIQGLFLNILPF